MLSIQEDAMPDDVHRIEFRAKSIEDLRSYLKGTAVDLGCRPVVRKVGDEYVVEGYAPLAAVEQARTAASGSPVIINVIENASEIGRARQAEVGSANRFTARTAPPRGLGIKE
jgi:hypothetical protein